MRAEHFLGHRPRDTGAEHRFAGDLVEVQQLVEASQIQRYRCGELAPDRVESADHTGAATERDDGDAVLRAVLQGCGDLVVGSGQQHGIRSILLTGVLAPQQVQRRLAAGAQQAVPVVEAAVVRAHDGGQCGPVVLRQG
jgi:hypothetical protein